ncbi:DUF6583 family protein [Bacillus sp. FJAT-22090]|uniref:DUF6583 family protein n=1 Tax=Bacillus sp. FJAT-22090 TaxID=1581038 RepID=UPI0011A4BAED|nr:DUF6583 family protein [Bacillus sp. FJAT-22090]
MKKRTWIIAIISLFVLAGGASAFYLAKKTPKEQYFYSEVKTIQHFQDLIETRYANEMDWAKKSTTSTTDNTYEFSGEYSGDTNPQIEQVLNNSNLALRMATDPNKQEVETEINATILGVDVDPIKGYITTEEIILELPFYDQLLQLKDKDYGNLMRTFDPSYSGSEKLGLENFLGKDSMLSEENREYLKKEYLMYLYESLPEESFTATDETIEVNGKSTKTEKVTMSLTETQVKKILTDVLEKAKKDPKFKAMVEEYLESSFEQFTATSMTDETFKFDEVMENLITSVDKIDLPAGINSTIWHNADLIVKREFNMEIADAGALKIIGTQSLEDSAQNWDYTISMDNDPLHFTGDLTTSKDGTYKDKISLLDDNKVGIVYNGEEKVTGDDRTFERTFIVEDEYQPMEFAWSGNSAYKKDSMKANHEFSIQLDNRSNAIINMKQASKIIKKVNLPSKSEKMVNIGTMDAEALQQLMMEDIYPELERWGMSITEQLEQELY